MSSEMSISLKLLLAFWEFDDILEKNETYKVIITTMNKGCAKYILQGDRS